MNSESGRVGLERGQVGVGVRVGFWVLGDRWSRSLGGFLPFVFVFVVVGVVLSFFFLFFLVSFLDSLRMPLVARRRSIVVGPLVVGPLVGLSLSFIYLVPSSLRCSSWMDRGG